MNIICLDIDDCILNSNTTYAGNTEDDLELLEINLKRIVKIIQKWDCKIFITSAWRTILKLEDNNLIYKGYYSEKSKQIEKSYYRTEINAFNLISKYLNGYVIGLSCGSRERDILNLLKEGHKVIAFDDIDLSEINHENYLYLYVDGFVSNHHLFRIYNFIENKGFICEYNKFGAINCLNAFSN